MTDQVVPAQNITVVRIKPNLDPIQFRQTPGIGDGVIHPEQLRVTDEDWAYYAGHATGDTETRIVLQRKTEQFHTSYSGELRGRAKEQIDDLDERIDNLNSGFTLDPDYFLRDTTICLLYTSPSPRDS